MPPAVSDGVDVWGFTFIEQADNASVTSRISAGRAAPDRIIFMENISSFDWKCVTIREPPLTKQRYGYQAGGLKFRSNQTKNFGGRKSEKR